jgi:hypothetical protein
MSDEKYLKSISIDKLRSSGEISARAYHVCYNADLENTNKLIIHFLSESNFLSLRNCGSNTNTELCKVALKYIQRLSKPQTSDLKIHLSGSDLKSRVLLEVEEFENSGAIFNLLLNEYNIDNQVRIILRRSGVSSLGAFKRQFISLRKQFRTTHSPSQIYLDIVRLMIIIESEQLTEIITNKTDSLIHTYGIQYYQKKTALESLLEFGSTHCNLSFSQVFKSNLTDQLVSGEFKLLEFVNTWFSQTIKPRNYQIFIRCYKNTDDKAIQEIGDIYGISRKRIRDIVVKVHQSILTKLELFTPVFNQLFESIPTYYGLNESHLTLDFKLLDSISQNETSIPNALVQLLILEKLFGSKYDEVEFVEPPDAIAQGKTKPTKRSKVPSIENEVKSMLKNACVPMDIEAINDHLVGKGILAETSDIASLKNQADQWSSIIYNQITEKYGLRKWGSPKSDTKAMLLKEVCLLFETRQKEVMHIDDIVSHLNDGHKVNHTTLISTLRKGSKIGLKEIGKGNFAYQNPGGYKY